jgi:hypothetical protein
LMLDSVEGATGTRSSGKYTGGSAVVSFHYSRPRYKKCTREGYQECYKEGGTSTVTVEVHCGDNGGTDQWKTQERDSGERERERERGRERERTERECLR